MTETVLKGVLGPSFATSYEDLYHPRPAWAYRAGDGMDLLIPALSDVEAGHYAVPRDAGGSSSSTGTAS